MSVYLKKNRSQFDGLLNRMGVNYEQTKTGYTIKGNVDFSDIKIIFLPDNLTVQGDLNLATCPIERLPQNLVVKGNLDCTDSGLKYVGGDVAAKSIIVTGTKIKGIPSTALIGRVVDKAALEGDDSRVKILKTYQERKRDAQAEEQARIKENEKMLMEALQAI